MTPEQPDLAVRAAGEIRKLFKCYDESAGCECGSDDQIAAIIRANSADVGDLCVAVSQLLVLLESTEESDAGSVFHPTTIQTCRCDHAAKLDEIMPRLKAAIASVPQPRVNERLVNQFAHVLNCFTLAESVEPGTGPINGQISPKTFNASRELIRAAESIPAETLTDELATALHQMVVVSNQQTLTGKTVEDGAREILARYNAMKGKQ